VKDLYKCHGECLCIGNNPYGADLDCLMEWARDAGVGQALYDNVGVRYGIWAWDDQEKMREYIHDCDPFRHGLHQAKVVATPFIQVEGDFTKEESKMLLMANVLHDFHEYLDGDVDAQTKTRESDEKELETNLAVVGRILGLEPDDPFLKDYRGVIGDFEGWSRVGRAFHDIEFCGYFLTSVRAWHLKDSPELTPEEQDKCRAMALQCSAWAVPTLLKSEFVYPRILLGFYEEQLAEMQSDGHLG